MRKATDKSNVNVEHSTISGANVNIAGRDITTHHTSSGLSAGEIQQLFAGLYVAIENHSSISQANKEDLKAEIEEIQSTVTVAIQKSKQLDEGFLARRFRNIARMAPDILDVVVTTLANPLAGLGVAVAKIAQKAKAETKS